MQNRKFKHKIFLSENNIKINTLPDLLQKRIRGLDEFVEDYQHTLNEDQQVMEDNIIQLDLEIEEDLYELYEEQLENNESIEEVAPEKIKKIKEVEKVKRVKEVVQKAQVTQAPSDEDILDQLWKINRRENLKRSFLKESGIKTPIKGWNISIGKYQLKRSSLFSYTYQLRKLAKESNN